MAFLTGFELLLLLQAYLMKFSFLSQIVMVSSLKQFPNDIF